jgi:homotetrameric cytidine deaminase
MKINAIVEKAHKMAIAAQDNAHAPYSKFYVGAAIKLKNSDDIVTGCNLENASFGATVCAERGAIQTANAISGKPDMEFIVVVSNTEPAIGPCGLCLQVISEFATPELPIYLANRNEVQRMVTFGDLLSSPFSEIPKTI